MTEKLALAICCIFVLWLFVRARKSCPMTSRALWIPLLWVMILGSRPVSQWFGAGKDIVSPEDYLDGSPFDRNVYLSLIIAGFLVLLMRRVKWGRLLASNRWVFVFFIYFGISAIWSDYPFVSFKRWIKDAGNIVMILIILSETAPVQAFRAVLARYTFVAIPFSVLLIRYFPDIGMSSNAIWDPSQPDNWTHEALYCGITTAKNALGSITFLSGVFLVWDFVESRTSGHDNTTKADLFGRAVLMSMVAWLIVSAHSATALVCLLLGAAIVLSLRLPLVRRRVRYLGTFSLILGFLALLIYSAPGILEASVGMVGRNATLTGRTDMWADLLKVPINPVIGTGYQSFWQGRWVTFLWEKYPLVIQAHNGYLETYLNGGLVGLFLLLALIFSTGVKLKRVLIDGSREGALFFSFFVAILFYNWTEASFFGLSLVWFIMLLVALGYSSSSPEPMKKLAEAYTQ